MATIQVRVSDKQKKNTEKIFESLGLDMTTAVRMFLSRVEMAQGIPFPVRKDLTINGFTPEFEAEVLAAAKETEGSISFDNPDEAVAYIRNLAQEE